MDEPDDHYMKQSKTTSEKYILSHMWNKDCVFKGHESSEGTIWGLGEGEKEVEGRKDQSTTMNVWKYFV